jgi:integrase
MKKFLTPLLTTELAGRTADELAFPSRKGGWLTEGELRWVMDPAAKAVEQEGLTPHELRHTCATMAIAAGANIKVLQKLMGHKTATLTWDRYGHLYPDDLDAIADAFDEAATATAGDLRAIGTLRAVLSE